MVLKSSPERWIEVPLPLEAKLISPDFVLSSSINSFTDLAGSDGCTTRTLGTAAISPMGTKSLAVS